MPGQWRRISRVRRWGIQAVAFNFVDKRIRPSASFFRAEYTSVRYRDENWLGACPKLGSFSISSGFRAAYCGRVCRYPRLGVPISPSGPLPLVGLAFHVTDDRRIGSEVLLPRTSEGILDGRTTLDDASDRGRSFIGRVPEAHLDERTRCARRIRAAVARCRRERASD